MKLLTDLSPASCYFLLLRFKCSSQKPVPKRLRSECVHLSSSGNNRIPSSFIDAFVFDVNFIKSSLVWNYYTLSFCVISRS